MTWTDPGLPMWAAVIALLVSMNSLALLISLAIERWGLPKGWSIQGVARKPGMLRRHLPLIAGNLSVMVIGAGIAFYLFADSFVFEQPTLLGAAATFAGLVLFDDFGFYWIHRTLHTNRDWYRRFHKQHHQAYAPVPIEYIHAHPVEWITGTLPPVTFIVGTILVTGSMNAWVLLAWAAFRQLHEMDIHSGTHSLLARILPLYGTVRQHDLHHARPHSGNYASTLSIWDRIFDTRIMDADSATSRAS